MDQKHLYTHLFITCKKRSHLFQYILTEVKISPNYSIQRTLVRTVVIECGGKFRAVWRFREYIYLFTTTEERDAT